MAILYAIPAISGSYLDIAGNPDKYFFKNSLFKLVGIFYE